MNAQPVVVFDELPECLLERCDEVAPGELGVFVGQQLLCERVG